MSFHSGSSRMAHNLDRFSFNSVFEDIAGEAARLNVCTDTVRQYVDWYGDATVTVVSRAGMKAMPAYEYEIRWQIHGEQFKRFQQLELAFPVPQNHYAYERQGW